jgi:hypothetical protein
MAASVKNCQFIMIKILFGSTVDLQSLCVSLSRHHGFAREG